MTAPAKRRVLLVESDYDLCEVLKKLLEQEDFQVDLAFSTFDALSKISLAEIIVTETKLLGIDHDKITKIATFEGIPVIYFTADLDFVGPTHNTLYKPTPIAEILSCLERTIK